MMLALVPFYILYRITHHTTLSYALAAYYSQQPPQTRSNVTAYFPLYSEC